MEETDGAQRRFAAPFPSEVGKLAVVTSSTGSIGFEIAMALAVAGAGRHRHRTPFGGRTRGPVEDSALRSQRAGAFEKLDLESQGSVADFANRLSRAGRPVALLINNANTLVLLTREVTPDGFELHLATNFLSHFSLTARLLPLLRASKNPRVVQLTSTGRHYGEINLNDLQLESKLHSAEGL